MKYSPKMTKTVCELLMGLAGRYAASKAAGISYETFRVWYKIYPEFKKAVDSAEEQAADAGREMAIRTIFAAMKKGQWFAAAWWLERKYNPEFAQKQHHAIDLKKLPKITYERYNRGKKGNSNKDIRGK